MDVAPLLVTPSVWRVHDNSSKKVAFSEASHQWAKEANRQAKNANQEIRKHLPIHLQAGTPAYNPR